MAFAKTEDVRQGAGPGPTPTLDSEALRREIAERECAEKALRRTEGDFRELIEKTLDAVVVHRRGTIVYVNPVWASIFGYPSPSDLIGTSVLDLVHEHQRASVADRIRAMWETGVATPPGLFRMRRRDGKDVLLEVAPVRVIQFDGDRAILVVGRDITERSELEARLLQADRLASIGLLAAGVGHEINNPLAYLLINLNHAAAQIEALETDLHDERLPALRAAVDEARGAAERMRLIVADLRAFARADEEPLRPIDVRQGLELALKMTLNEIRHRATVARDYGAVPLVDANEGRLGQVFSNLLINAAHAIPEGAADKNAIRLATRTDAQGRAIVEVNDTGRGIDPQDLARIFEPFFTTKPVGGGMGLGLSICRTLVTSLGGEIAVESEVGHGSTFRVVLPASASRVGPPSPPPAAPAITRKGRVLVVDDEVAFGRAVRLILEPEHEVVTAGGGREALRRIAGGDRFDLILCDLMMPDLCGIDLYEELRRVAPEQVDRMAFVTGGAFTPRAREFLERVPNARLHKPFDEQNLMTLLAQALQESEPRPR